MSTLRPPLSSLTPQQLQAIEMLANSESHAQIAQVLGISTKTIQRWLKKPKFTQALADVQLRTVEKAVEAVAEDISGQIQRLVPKAIKTLETYLDDPKARGSDRLRAAQILGNWAGLNQPQIQPERSAEQNLKDYLTYLAANNNGANNNAAN